MRSQFNTQFYAVLKVILFFINKFSQFIKVIENFQIQDLKESMDENYIKTLCDILDFDVSMKSEFSTCTKASIEENDCNTKYKLSIFLELSLQKY